MLIVGIVAALGIPSLQNTIQNGRLTSQLNQMVGVVAYARNEAAKRPNTSITLCATSDPNASPPQCNTTTWESSYIMFTDANNDRAINSLTEDANGDGVLDPGEDTNGNGVIDTIQDELIQVGRTLEGGNTLRTSGFPNAGFIQFDSSGIPSSSGTFTLCDDRGATRAKAIIMSVVGHVRVAVDEDAATVNTGGNFPVNDHTGANVICP